MKKFFLIALSAIFVLNFNKANAKIRRVGYPGAAVSSTDYPNLQSANDASINGDTIYIFPGSWSATVNHKIVFFSYGYSASTLDSTLQNIKGTIGVTAYLTSGSTGSIFKGIDNLIIQGHNNGDSITINRCNISSVQLNANGSAGAPFKNWQITQSIINSLYFVYGGGVMNNLSISNCIIGTFTFGSAVSGSSTGVLTNNIFLGSTNNTNFNNSSFSCSNNIFICPNLLNITASTFKNNIASSNSIPATDNNKINVDPTTIFSAYPVNGFYTGYGDAGYKLASNSPAKKAGINGTDCGIFGGTDSYTLGGIPPIPSFYKLTAPSNIASSNPYTITFSVKGNN